MNPRLHVGAVIDSSTPAAWVADLIQRLHSNAQYDLTVASASTVPDKTHDEQHPDLLPEHLLTGVSHWWMQHVIDKPRFEHDPWIACAMPIGVAVHLLEKEPAILSSCDVVVNLCSSDNADQLNIGPDTPHWSAQLINLNERIEYYLLHNSPLIWLHLWNVHHDQSAQSHQYNRVASHSLPCQTFSITDLKRMCYSSLPGLFESRLNWMANHSGSLPAIEEQEAAQGVFDAERDAAREDAFKWQQTGHQNKLTSEVTRKVAQVLLVARIFFHQLFVRLRSRYWEECWQMAAYNGASEHSTTLDVVSQVPVSAYTDLAESTDAIWADPHTVEHQGEPYVFFEKLPSHNTYAHLAVAKIKAADQLGKPVTALQEKHHLSYPHVFKHQGELYMIPETGALNSIRLYRCSNFPDTWIPVSNIVDDINAADSTLLFNQNRWWLFTNCQSHPSVDERDELHVYFADELTGPWHGHPLNPVLTGVDRARMGGSIVTQAGTHYRLSQYGANRYGYGINISRIDELSTTAYRETALYRIIPESGSRWQGCHTLAFSNGLTIIDRMRYRRKRS